MASVGAIRQDGKEIALPARRLRGSGAAAGSVVRRVKNTWQLTLGGAPGCEQREGAARRSRKGSRYFMFWFLAVPVVLGVVVFVVIALKSRGADAAPTGSFGRVASG